MAKQKYENWNISLGSFESLKTTNEMCRISPAWTHAWLNTDYLNSIITGMFPAGFFLSLFPFLYPSIHFLYFHWRKENKQRVAKMRHSQMLCQHCWGDFDQFSSHFLFNIQFKITFPFNNKKNASCNMISKKWMPWTLAIAT